MNVAMQNMTNGIWQYIDYKIMQNAQDNIPAKLSQRAQDSLL